MQVIVNLETTIVQYADGTTSAGTKVTLVAPAGAAEIPSQTIPVGAVQATFDGVPDGVGYTATAQLLDGNSNLLGVPASSSAFDVVTKTVGIATPISISVSVQ